jgi:hypothetical protein
MEIRNINDFITLITGTSSAFMSSIMINKSEFDKISHKDKFIESSLNQIYIIFTLIESTNSSCVYNNSVFSYANNLSGGYQWPKIFIENYLNLLEYFKTRGSVSEHIVRYEKERMLKESVLRWFKIFWEQNRIKQFGMECLDEYLFKYYRNEPYFNEVYEAINDIRNRDV